MSSETTIRVRKPAHPLPFQETGSVSKTTTGRASTQRANGHPQNTLTGYLLEKVKYPLPLKISQCTHTALRHQTFQTLWRATQVETRSFPSALQTGCNISSLLKNPPLIYEQIRKHHKETNKSRSWDKTTSLVSSKVNVMKTGEMVLGLKHYWDITTKCNVWVLAGSWFKTKQNKTKIFETKHIRNKQENWVWGGD